MLPTELPVNVQNNKIMKWVVTAILVVALLQTIMLGIAHIKQGIPLFIPITILVVAVVFAFAQLKIRNPINIEITRTAVKITPIKVLGIEICRPENLSLTDFEKIEVAKRRDKYSTGFKIILRGKSGKKDVKFDAPAGNKEEPYAASLGALINLPFSQ